MPDLDLSDVSVLVGVDEVGTGSWAGPAVAACVVAPLGWVPMCPVRDSKAMTPATREQAAKALNTDPNIAWAIRWTDAAALDDEGLGKALRRMHTELVEEGLALAEQRWPGQKAVAIVDGNVMIPNAVSIPRADARFTVVSAASVIAKVKRDTWMTQVAEVKHPGYGFTQSKGYGTKAHEAALQRLGPCEIHRKSYAPIAKFMQDRDSGAGALSIEDLMDVFDDM